MVFCYKSNVNGLRIRLPFFEPEKISFAIAKTFQVWVSVFAFVVYKGCDPKWLQSLGIESNRTLEVTDCENNVVRSEEHTSELQSPDHLVCRLLLEKKKKE